MKRTDFYKATFGTEGFNILVDQYEEEPMPCAQSESWVEAHDKHLIEKIKQVAETFDTNNSLMVYTSGVNRINIEDRTMNINKAISEVRGEIKQLHDALDNEIQKVGNVLLMADVSDTAGAPKVNAEFLSEEWDHECKAQEKYIKAVHAGQIAPDVVVTIMHLGNISKSIEMTEELREAIEQFEDHIFNKYALKLKELDRRYYNLSKIREAERAL